MAKKSLSTARENEASEDIQYTVLSPKAIKLWALLIIAAGLGMAVWLLLAFTSGDSEANRNKLDAIRTAGTVVVGTGGAAALLLAARRQRASEIALKLKQRDQADVARTHALQERVAADNKAHQEKIAADSRTDAAERRITELYLKAVEQLGSDKAPVRFGGLYALERVAQDNESQRQTIINVLCAYLRMPFDQQEPSSDEEAVSAEFRGRHRDWQQEREVRLAAQRILRIHLRPGDHEASPERAFYWANIDLDLTGATLLNLDLTRCEIRNGLFHDAIFIGNADFEFTTFTRDARFNGAIFSSEAMFNGVKFRGRSAWFYDVKFEGKVAFNGSTFDVDAKFARSTFCSGTSFLNATFSRDARFEDVTFEEIVDFVSAKFRLRTRFDRAKFEGRSEFGQAEFGSDTSFEGTAFRLGEPVEIQRLQSI